MSTLLNLVDNCSRHLWSRTIAWVGLVLLSFSAGESRAATTGLNWELKLAGSPNAVLHAVAADETGGVYAAGWANKVGISGTSAWHSRFGSAGETLWLSGFGNSDSRTVAAALRPGGGVTFGAVLSEFDSPNVHVSRWTAAGSPETFQGFLISPYRTIPTGVAAGPNDYAFACATSQRTNNVNVNFVSVRGYNANSSILSVNLETASDDRSKALAVDAAGNLYVAWMTRGSFAGSNHGDWDQVLTKIAPGGSILWSRQVGTGAADLVNGVTVDGSGNVYLAGETGGALGGVNGGGSDASLIKFDANGNVLWSRQRGGSANESFYGVSVDPQGNAFVIEGLGADSNGFYATDVVAYDVSGNDAGVWHSDSLRPKLAAQGISADHLGNIFVAGSEPTGIGSGSSGFLLSLSASAIPEPGLSGLFAVAQLLLIRRRRVQRSP